MDDFPCLNQSARGATAATRWTYPRRINRKYLRKVDKGERWEGDKENDRRKEWEEKREPNGKREKRKGKEENDKTASGRM